VNDDIDSAWAYTEEHERFERECFTTGDTTMALVKDMIQSKFLRKEDFDEDQVCTIRDCRLENVGKEDDAEQRWVLYFREREKGMVLNVTTIRVLEQAYGGDSDHWVSNKVMVYVDPNVSFGGKVVGGLRLRTPKKQAVKAPPPPADEGFDDEKIPF
jgi:hypothetical protein